MNILKWDKPKKARSTEEHNKAFSSEAAEGSFVPNMSKGDMLAWKAKLIGGEDPRVEIRKTVEGVSRPVPGREYTMTNTAQVLIVVRSTGVLMSANGKMEFDYNSWRDMYIAVQEARSFLHTKHWKTTEGAVIIRDLKGRIKKAEKRLSHPKHKESAELYIQHAKDRIAEIENM